MSMWYVMLIVIVGSDSGTDVDSHEHGDSHEDADTRDSNLYYYRRDLEFCMWAFLY